MLLFLPVMHRALSYYQKLLLKQIPPPEIAQNSKELAVDRIITEPLAVTISGLQINDDLQGRIIDAVVRTEIQAGIKVFIALEQALINEMNHSIDQNVKTALRQLILALIEQYSNF